MGGASRQRVRLWGRRVAWLLTLWIVSIAALAALAYLLRIVMNLAGLTV